MPTLEVPPGIAPTARANRPVTVTVLVTLLSLAAPVPAQDTASTATDITRTSPSDARDTPLSVTEQHQANAWELNESEWRRYRQLMLGIRGSVSDARLSPVEVLGIHARDEAERRHYAMRWAEAMRADAERVLAFQRAYDAAAEQLFAGQPVIDAGRLKTVPQTPSALKPGDRVLFFTTLECPACDAMLAKLLAHLNTVAGIDIYFTDLTDLGPGSEARIRAWADEHTIEPAWVQGRRVTLNIDNGALASVSGEGSQAPLLFRRRGDTLAALSYADL
jgi:integrating conjugative element protein (TIGR03759 family)